MTKDFIIIWAGMLAVGVAVWAFSAERQGTETVRTEAARVAAHDPALKQYSEKSPYMRNER